MKAVNQQLQARLKRYKDNAASMAARYPQSEHYSDWRNNRYPKPAILKCRNQITRNSKNPRIIYADSFECLPLTLEGDAHEFARLGYTGWLTGEDCGILKGAVLSFRDPHSTNDENENSHIFYLAATYHTDCDGVAVYAYRFRIRRNAALYADECARVQAERCRAETLYADARYQLEQRAIEAREELHGLNVSTLQLIREIKAARQSLTPAICSVLTAALKRALKQRAALFQTIQTGA